MGGGQWPWGRGGGGARSVGGEDCAAARGCVCVGGGAAAGRAWERGEVEVGVAQGAAEAAHDNAVWALVAGLNGGFRAWGWTG